MDANEALTHILTVRVSKQLYEQVRSAAYYYRTGQAEFMRLALVDAVNSTRADAETVERLVDDFTELKTVEAKWEQDDYDEVQSIAEARAREAEAYSNAHME